MTACNHRVTAADAATGTEFIREHFENAADADAYFEALQTDRDGILAALPYRSAVITREEDCWGTWVVRSRKAVVKTERR